MPPVILSFDTTTRAGSVAVLRGEEVLIETAGDPAVTHGHRLPGDVERALAAAGVRMEEVELIAVAAGPGSFTGLRVGIATAQGLAFARGLRVVPISTLDALAREAAGAAAVAPGGIAVWVDAQRGEVFSALYAADGRSCRIPPSPAPPADTLDAWAAAPGAAPAARLLFTGDGAVRYRTVIAERLGARADVREPAPLLAGIIGRMAAAEPGRAVLPHAVVPIYVRRPDAELARERPGRP